MSQGEIAERYAQALFELGAEANQLAAVCDGLTEFEKAYEKSEELRETLSNPLVSPSDARQLLTQVAARMGLSELTTKALIVIWMRRRLPAIAEIVHRLSQLRDDKEGVVRAQLTTAVAMPDEYYRDLTARLQQATGRRVVLDHSVDGTLIGGAVARVGGAVVDASVAGRLRKLEHDVLKAISAGAA